MRRGGQLGSFYLGAVLVVAAGVVTLAATFLLGSMLLPSGRAGTTDDGRPSFDVLTGSQAIVTASGDVEGVVVLDQLSVEEYNEETREGDPIDLSLTFRGGGTTLLIRAEALTPNTPAPASRLVISIGAHTFYVDPGGCTVELSSIDYVVVEPAPIRAGPPRGRPIPAYTGTLYCPDLHEFQGDTVVTIDAAFQYRPEESPLS